MFETVVGSPVRAVGRSGLLSGIAALNIPRQSRRRRLLTGCAGAAMLALPSLVDLGVAVIPAQAQQVITNSTYTTIPVISSTPGVTLMNTGQIEVTSGSAVAFSNGGSVANNGTASVILGDGYGVSISGAAGTVTNEGTITGSGGAGVQLNDGGLVANSGSITSSGTGVFLEAAGSVANIGTASSISGSAYGVRIFAAASTVTNEGTITAFNGTGVSFIGGGSVANNGTASRISGSVVGVDIGGAAGAVTNAGTITGSGTIGVYLDDGGLVTNTGTASLISGPNSGVSIAHAAGAVTNDGTITGYGTSGVGVGLNAGGSVANTGTASLIRGAGYGVFLGATGTVTNAGTITGSGAASVLLNAGGSVANIGTASLISGGNYGVRIVGAPGTVTNEGTISGTTAAVRFAGAGVNELIVGAQAHFTGAIIGSTAANTTNIALFEGSRTFSNALADNYQHFTVFGAAANSTLTNTGSITVPLVAGGAGASLINVFGASITSSGSYAVGGLASGVTVTNAGGITATGTSSAGLRFDNGGSVANTGTASLISGGTYGVSYGVLIKGAAGTVTNDGTIIATGTAGTGVSLNSGGSIANTGTASLIRGGDYGAGIFSYGSGGTVTNAGTITASSGVGVFLDGGGLVANSGPASLISGHSDGVNITGFGTVTNAGTITGSNGAGVYLTGGSVANNGTIGGATYGVRISISIFGTVTNAGQIIATGTSGVGVSLNSGGSVANGSTGVISGSKAGVEVTGGIAGYSSSVANNGTIGGATYGVRIAGAAGTVTNAGGIIATGTSGVGVSLNSGGSVANDLTGVISGSKAGVEITGGIATVTNRGLISSNGVGVLFSGTSNGTVDNFGTISGGSGQAVRFAGGTGANELIIESGGVLQGVANGGNGNSTLLVLGTGTISQAQITGFSAVQFAGTGPVDPQTTISNAVVSGSLANAGTLTGALSVSNGGTLINLSVVNTTSVSSNMGVLNNSGTLTNSSTFTNQNAIANNGGITNNNSFANAGTLTNSGAFINTGMLTNSGTFTNQGSLTNSGTFTNTGTLTNSSIFTNTSSGTVTSTGNGITGSGSIDNAGTITGGTAADGVQLAGGTVTNRAGGLIQGGNYGLVLGSGGTLFNSGTILDAAVAGASFGSDSTGTNQTSGVIGGVTGLIFTGTGATLTNYGAIKGSGGTAVQFDAGTNTLVLGTGTSLTGAIDGGGGAGQIQLIGTGTLGSSNNIGNFGAGSALAVGTGAVWTASGSWAIANVTNAGTLQPGSAGNPLRLTGNFTQAAGGTLRVLLNAGANTGSELVVTGTAALAGTVAVVTSGSFVVGAPYTIVAANGGVTGTFRSVSVSSPLLSAALSYDAQDAFVTLTQLRVATPPTSPASPPTSPASPPPPPPPAPNLVESTNQHAVAVAFDAGVAASAKGFAAALTGLDRLDAGGVTSSLDRLSGESQASLTTTALQAVHSFGDQIGLQGALARGSAREDQVAGASRVQLASLGGTSDDPVATIDRPWGVWASGYGQTRQLGGNGNTHQLDETVVGGAFGADYTFDRTPDHSLRIGAAVGYGGTNFSIDSGGGSAQVDRTQFALYSGYTLDHVYLDGAVGIGFGEGATRRNIALPGVPGVATGQPTDVSFLAQAEAGYDFDVGGVVITPLAGIQVATDIGDRFSESGGPQALSIASQSQSSVQSTFGGRLAVNLPGAVALDLQVGWAHEFAPTNRSINVGFISQPGNRFTIQGAQAVSDSAKLGLGLAHQFTERSNVYLRYDTELASNADSHAITGGFRLTW